MENVVSLNPNVELKDFFEFHYQDQQGFVYSPTKDPTTEEWNQAYFEWPKQANQLIQHVLQNTPTKEVYFSPALFSQPSAKKEYVKGSYTVWVEFDGNAPTSWNDLPAPSLRVRSSEAGHEHVYWKFDYFEVDVDKIEATNRALSYKLNADTSGWDANQVLRPVATLNHKRGKNVTTLTRSANHVSVEFFETLPQPTTSVATISLDAIPEALDVIAKYKWDPEAFEFFRKKDIPTGSRSSAMMRLGFYCAEMKMSDAEAFSILNNADGRWGKFAKRSDRVTRLLDIINKARIKFPLIDSDVIVDDLPIYDFQEFMDFEAKIEWVIPGILQKAGSLLLTGPPGTGKTQMTLRFAMAMATGKPFIGWEITRPHKIVMFSMEMGHADLKYFLEQMTEELSDVDRQHLKDNLHIVPIGYPLLLDTPVDQAKVTRIVNHYTPEGVIFDSLGNSTNEELSERVTKTIFDYIDRMRSHNDVFVWFIHHNRKPQINNKKPNKLSDVYGSQYVVAKPTTIVGLYPIKKNLLAVTGLKVRLSKPFDEFIIARSDSLDYTLYKDDTGLLKNLAAKADSEDVTEDDSGYDDTFGMQ